MPDTLTPTPMPYYLRTNGQPPRRPKPYWTRVADALVYLCLFAAIGAGLLWLTVGWFALPAALVMLAGWSHVAGTLTGLGLWIVGGVMILTLMDT